MAKNDIDRPQAEQDDRDLPDMDDETSGEEIRGIADDEGDEFDEDDDLDEGDDQEDDEAVK